MTRHPVATRVMAAALFVALALLVLLVKLVPLDLGGQTRLAAPDLLLCLVLAWAIRRPDLLPLPLIAAVMLLADLVLLRPPGLWAGLVVLATEWLRRRQRPLRAQAFALEWAMVGAVMVVLAVAQWGVLAVMVVQQPTLGQQLLQVPVTLAAYPLVVVALHLGAGIRKRPAIVGFGRGAQT